jgi:hypothetical protein
MRKKKLARSVPDSGVLRIKKKRVGWGVGAEEEKKLNEDQIVLYQCSSKLSAW